MGFRPIQNYFTANEIISSRFLLFRKIGLAMVFHVTIGHAVESYYLAQGKKLLHGEAVAIGMICEAYISCVKGSLRRIEYLPILQLIGKVYTGLPHIEPDAIPAILKLTGNDKKNAAGQNRFTLLNGIGNFSVDNNVEEETIINSLEYYSQLSR